MSGSLILKCDSDSQVLASLLPRGDAKGEPATPAQCPTICISPICESTRCWRPQAISQPIHACRRI
ncbi:MAG TPA: hypothetical protein V6D14_00235 [Coleofasciculaceae cyanobacterium]